MINQQQRRGVDSEIGKILQVMFCTMNDAVMWRVVITIWLFYMVDMAIDKEGLLRVL